MSIAIKFCGLRSEADIAAAVAADARYVGLVFFEASPRYLTHDAARGLAHIVPAGTAKVALVVDISDASLDALMADVPIDMLQLHGSEPPERVAEIRARTGLPVMKALGIETAADLPAIDRYGSVADQLLIDAKPPKGATRPGGNALAFEWQLITGHRWSVPWMLAGGLTPENVTEAVRLTGARQVDVSSGVDRAPGVKDPAKIAAFAAALSALPAANALG